MNSSVNVCNRFCDFSPWALVGISFFVVIRFGVFRLYVCAVLYTYALCAYVYYSIIVIVVNFYFEYTKNGAFRFNNKAYMNLCSEFNWANNISLVYYRTLASFLWSSRCRVLFDWLIDLNCVFFSWFTHFSNWHRSLFLLTISVVVCACCPSNKTLSGFLVNFHWPEVARQLEMVKVMF